MTDDLFVCETKFNLLFVGECSVQRRGVTSPTSGGHPDECSSSCALTDRRRDPLTKINVLSVACHSGVTNASCYQLISSVENNIKWPERSTDKVAAVYMLMKNTEYTNSFYVKMKRCSLRIF